MSFSYPGSAGIRSAGSNFTAQAGPIAMQAAENIGNIQMQMAQLRAQGIMQGTQAWTNAMSQFAAATRAIPAEQRAAEDQRMQRQQFQYNVSQRPATEAYKAAETGHLNQETQLAQEQIDKAQKAKQDFELHTQLLSEGGSDLEVMARAKELGRPDIGAGIIQGRANLQTSLKNADKATREDAISSHKAIGDIAGAWINRPKDLAPTEEQALFTKTVKDAEAMGMPPGTLGSSPSPYADMILNNSYHVSVGAVKEWERNNPTPSEKAKQFSEFSAGYRKQYPETPGGAKGDIILKKAFEKDPVYGKSAAKPFEGGTVGSSMLATAIQKGYGSVDEYMKTDPTGYKSELAKAALLVPSTTATLRMENYQKPVYDTKLGTTLYASPDDINKMNVAEPGRYTVAAQDPTAQAKKSSAVQFATGTESDQVQSFRTFLGHANDLSNAVDSAKLTNQPWINKPYNWLRQQTGDPAITAYIAKIEPVRKEYASFLLNNRALEADDRTQAEKIANENLSPLQMQAALKSFAHTANIRMGSLALKQMDNNQGASPVNIYDKRSTDILGKFGEQPLANVPRGTSGGMTRIKASDGIMHDIPTANIDAAKKIDPGLKIVGAQ